MTVWRLVFREVRFRGVSFALGVLAVTVAVASLVGAFTALHAFDLRSEWLLAEREARIRDQMQHMQDDYRKITLGLGFNILILPKEQNLGDLYAQDFASKLMPEANVARLTSAQVMTIAHVLPVLQQKVVWPEYRRTILLVGTSGEAPQPGENSKRPLLESVRPGTIALGYELHRSLGLTVGKSARLFGRSFRVARCNPERGSKDDITAWIPLRDAQALLHRPGQINGIFALSCKCEGDRLPRIRREVASLLPDTQVVEFASQAVARAEARERAAAAARQARDAEAQDRARLRGEREKLAAFVVAVVLIACTLWIALLAFGNVHERRSEIGILRALGVRGGQVLLLFLARALLVGVLGALLGWGIGALSGAAAGGAGWRQAGLLDARSLLAVMLLAPILSALASWVPAAMAAQQDPAEVLAEE